MTLLQRLDRERRERCEQLRLETRERLRSSLRRHLPGATVYVYGSLVRPGGFRESSDVDIALLEEPADCSIFLLQAQIEDDIGRDVDLVLLSETRLRAKIEREGERWTS